MKTLGRVLMGMAALTASVSSAQLPPLGNEFQVNTFTLGFQEDADVACTSDGSSVSAFEGRPSVNDHNAAATIYAQRFDPDGMRLGAPIEVPIGGSCGPTRFNTSICRDTNGNTVEVYSTFPDGDLRGQRFDATGGALGSELQIAPGNGPIYGSLFNGHDVGCEDNGDFVVVWQDLDFANHSVQLSGRRYASAGIPLGSKLQISSYTVYPLLPSVAADDDGDFVVAWTAGQYYVGDNDGDQLGIFARRFNSAGMALGAHFQVNTHTTGDQFLSRVATDGDGDFVIVWRSSAYGSAGQDGSFSGVFGRRFASNGTAQGSEFQVNTYTVDDQDLPSVASDQMGNFVVVWTSFSSTQDGSNSGIFGQRFASGGAPLGSEFLVNAYTAGRQSAGIVAADDAGNFLVNWIDAGGRDGSSYGSFAQRFASGGGKLGGEFQVNTYTIGPQGLYGPSVSVGSAVSCEDGGRCGIAWAGAPEQPTATVSEVYLRHYDTSGNPETGEIVPPLAQCVVSRLAPSVCRDATGDFVVVWEHVSGDSYFSDADLRIAGQRYTSAGATKGTEFLVNTYTGGYPERPDVACLSGGEFLVVWEQAYLDGDRDGVLARRYTSSGSAGPEFQVNSYTGNHQYDAQVAVAGTDLVVVWTSEGQQDDADGGIFGQRLSSAGTPLGSEFQVSVHTVDSQIIPAVAGFGSGFVVAWMDEYLDGGQYGIFARVYDTTGTALGDDFQINTHTEDDQVLPAVAADATGNFMVVWQDTSGADGDNDGVFGRYFDSTGAPLSGELFVNTSTFGEQREPTVCAASDGTRFVTAWNNESRFGSIPTATAPGQAATAHSGFRSRARQSFTGQPFAASAGAARSLAAQAAGPFDGQDGSFSGIFGQIFGGTLPPPGSPPEITGGATPGSEEVTGQNGPNRGPNCLRVYELGANSLPDNGGPDDELLGQGGTDANGNFSIMLLRPLVAGDRIYIIDVCPPFDVDTPQVGPIALIFDPAVAPAMSWTMLAAALLLLSGIALLRLHSNRKG